MTTNNQLKALVERIERVEEERAELANDVREIYAEAKAVGFDPKIMRKLIALRKKDFAERSEEETLLGIYMNALGMTPIEQAIAGAALSANTETGS